MMNLELWLRLPAAPLPSPTAKWVSESNPEVYQSWKPEQHWVRLQDKLAGKRPRSGLPNLCILIRKSDPTDPAHGAAAEVHGRAWKNNVDLQEPLEALWPSYQVCGQQKMTEDRSPILALMIMLVQRSTGTSMKVQVGVWRHHLCSVIPQRPSHPSLTSVATPFARSLGTETSWPMACHLRPPKTPAAGSLEPVGSYTRQLLYSNHLSDIEVERLDQLNVYKTSTVQQQCIMPFNLPQTNAWYT